jgi:general stress protein 26
MTDQSNIQKVAELAKDIRIGMLTTIDAEGHLTARPMAQQEVEFDGDLWFFVEATSPTVVNLAANPNAGVTLTSNDTWISFSGKGFVVRDVDKARELWNSWVEAWLPQGPEDDSVVLIKFEAEGGRVLGYSGRTCLLISFAKAKVTGNRYEGGENETVRLN